MPSKIIIAVAAAIISASTGFLFARTRVDGNTKLDMQVVAHATKACADLGAAATSGLPVSGSLCER
jgi:Cdc6-like AAA superfamily ATPase